MRPHDLAPVIATSGKGPWWWACEYPERPSDEWTLWLWRCDPCYLHLVASERQGQGHEECGNDRELWPCLGLDKVNQYRADLGLRIYEAVA